MDLFWSSLPGIPKKLKWPVHVIKWEEKDKVLVFSRSDNSYFKVSRDQLVPFPGQLEKFKNLGLGLLKRQRKEGTFKEFEADIQWALDEATAEDSAKKKPGLSSKPRKKKYETKDDVTSEESSVSDYVDEDDKVEESLPHSPSQKMRTEKFHSDEEFQRFLRQEENQNISRYVSVKTRHWGRTAGGGRLEKKRLAVSTRLKAGFIPGETRQQYEIVAEMN